jgi:hypothetical protein
MYGSSAGGMKLPGNLGVVSVLAGRAYILDFFEFATVTNMHMQLNTSFLV